MQYAAEDTTSISLRKKSLMGPLRGIVGIAVAVPVAVLLAACGSSSSSPAKTTTTPASTTATSGSSTAPTSTTTTTANFNSCSVVTPAEAAAALGHSVTAGVLGKATVEGGLACVFYGPSAPTPHTPDVTQTDTVRVVVVKGPDATTWYNAYTALPEVRAEPVSGYGDQAFYDGFASLSVLKGDSYLRVAVSPAGAPPSLADEKQLATAILPNI